MEPIIIFGIIFFLFICIFGYITSRFRTCPSDKVLVVYGVTGSEKSFKCVNGGAIFVYPIIQDYQYLDLTPIVLDIDLQDALSKQNIRIDISSKFTVGISTEPGIMENAAQRLLGQSQQSIKDMATGIICGQSRLIIAQTNPNDLKKNLDKFISLIFQNVDYELKKLGLKLINININSIIDEDGKRLI